MAKGGPKLPATCQPSEDGPGSLTTMEMFARTLANRMGQTVVDRTGLAGWYCIRMRWTSDDGIPRSIGLPSGGGTSIYSAVQEQLGLKLEARKSQVPILVVDRVAPPRPN